MMGYTHAQLAALGVLLAVGSSSDVGLHRIPNWLTVSVGIAGAASQWAVGGWQAAGSGALAGLAVGALLAPFWTKRLIGGGDLKLAAAAGVWVGLARSPRYLLASAIAGGAIALVCYALSGTSARASIRANLTRLHVPRWSRAAEAPGQKVLVPYGAAFAAGALFALCY
jgi:prepilin peptidase CpaA